MKIVKKEKQRILLLISLLVLLFFLPAAYYLTTHPFKAQAAWFNDLWRFRQRVDITNNSGSNQTNYQISFTLNTTDTTKFQNDCDDIRVTASNGELLPHWIEENNPGCGSATTKIWTKVPSLPTSGAYLFVYYGNSTAGTIQDGDKVFEFFDDFNSGFLNTDKKWTIIGPASNLTFSSGYLDVSVTDVSDTTRLANGVIAKNYSGGPGIAIEARTQNATASIKDYGMYVGLTSSSSIGHFRADAAAELLSIYQQTPVSFDFTSASYGTSGYQGGAAAGTIDSWHKYMIRYISTSSAKFYRDGSSVTSHSETEATIPNSALFPELGGNDQGANDFNIRYDFVFVRKTAATEPSAAAPTNEEESPAPTAYWKFDEGYGTSISDASGHANTGSISGATWQTDDLCVSGKCLFFDGTNDAVTVSNTVAGVQTVSFWIKPATTTEQFIALNGSANITASGGTLSATGFTSPTIYVDGKVSSTITANRWQHIAVTTGTAISASAITIGQVGVNYGQTFIDDIKLYTNARTAAQVKTDYNAGKAHAATAKGTSVSFSNRDNNDALSNGLTGYWKMNEASSDAADSSGNSYTLTNNAIATFVSGKFGNAGNLVAASSQFFSTATDLGSVNTIAFWINPTSTTTYLVDLDGTKTITASSGTIAANNFADSTIYVNGVAGTTLTANVWQHVAVTTTSSITANSFKVGKVGSNFLDGKIDDVRLYNRALQPSEVSFLYNFAPGPIGYWKFDENTGTTANDVSGSANTGTWSGTGTHWATGKFGSAGKFGGNAFSDVMTTTTLNGTAFPYQGTISFWFKINNNATWNNWNALVSTVNTGGGTEPNWTSIQKAGTSAAASQIFVYFTNSSATQTIVSTNATFGAENGWTHFTVVWDQSNSSVKIYANGILDNSSSSVTTWPSIFPTFFLGKDRVFTDRYFDGLIDDFKLYNYARTAQQVVEDMNANHPAPGSPIGSPVGFWKFDEGYGASAFNSGNGGSLTGTLTPGAGGSHSTATQLWDRMGKFNRAVNLDGTDDLVTVSDNAALDLSSSFTLTSWVNFHSISPSAQSLIEKGVAAGTANYYLWWNRNAVSPNNTIICGFHDGTAFRDHDYAWAPDVNKWYQISCVFDDTLDLLKIYIDGVQVLSEAETNTPLADAGSLNLGANRNSSNNLSGKLDDIKIYSSALTTDQIKLDFNRGFTQVLGSFSTSSDGTTASNSAERSYCVPGDTGTCSAPVGEWKFNENTGSTANDTSGNGNTGTLTATPTWNVGKVGSALSFNGSTQFVSLPAAARPGATNAFTISAWVKKKVNGSYLGIYGNNNGTGTSGFTFWYNTSNLLECTKNGVVALAGATTITDQNWHYVSCVLNSSGMFLYLDGKLDASNSNTASIIDYNDVIYIGAINEGSNGNQKFFNGQIDQVRTYSSGRSTTQIAWDFNRGSPFAWWKFDECQGTTMNDASGNGYSGTWNGTGGGTQTAVGTCLTSGTAWFNGATGKFNSSLNFDGTDDYISLGDNSIWDFGTGNFAFSAWIKRAAQDAVSDTIISKDNNAVGTRQFIFTLLESTDQLRISYFKATDSEIYLDSTSTITDTSWHHVLGQRRGDSFDIYIDGKLDATGTTSGTHGSMQATVTEARIGNRPYSGFNDHFNGQIDDVRIYNYGLTQVQIKDLYNQGSAVRYGPASGIP